MTASALLVHEHTRIWELTVCPEAIRTCRDESVKRSETWGVDLRTVDMVRLSVSELLTNVSAHVADPRCRLELRLVGTGVFVSVEDHSPELPRLTEPDWQATSGRGLLLLHRTGDLGWTPTPEGKRVWVLCAPHPAGSTDVDSHTR